MSTYGTIPAAASSSTPPPPPKGSSSPPPAAPDDSTSCARCPRRAAAFPFRPWRELADPRALAVPAGGLTGARRRARANLAYFAANYQLVFLVVVSVSMLRRPLPMGPPTVLLGLVFLSSKAFPVIMTLQLLQLMFTGAAASVLVSLPVGLLLVGGHAVMHEYNCPAEDGAVDEEVGSIVWRRGVPPCDAPTATAVSKTMLPTIDDLHLSKSASAST
jgi:hypothetical protein